MKSNKYWFKPKTYGWGFVPISWEGWLLTLALLIIIFTSAYLNNFTNPNITIKNGLRFLLDLFLICSIFSFISIPKTKSKVKWRWGR